MRDYFPFISEIRFFSNGSWYFIIKNTHQLRDPSKRLKVKILDPSISTRYTELFLINDAFMMKFNDSSYRYRCIKLLNQLSRSFQFFFFFFFLDFRSLTNLLRTLFVPIFASPSVSFSSPSIRIVFYSRQNCISQLSIFKKNSPTENMGARFFLFQM